MTFMPRQVFTDSCGPVSVFEGGDIEGAVALLCAAVNCVVENDRLEADIARSCIKRSWYFTDNYDAKGTDARFAVIEQQVYDELASVVGSRLVCENNPLRVPAEHAGELGSWIETGDAIVPNMEGPFVEWKQIASGYREVAEEIQTLKVIEGWEGDGAEAYRLNVLRKAAWLDSLADLMDNCKAMTEAVSNIQALLSSAIWNTIKERTPGNNLPDRDNLKGLLKFNETETRESYQGLSNNELFQVSLYQRTSRMVYELVQLRASIRKVDDESQAWRKLAVEAGDKLIAAVEAAKQHQQSLTDYNSTTTVDTDPRTCAIITDNTDPHIKDGW